MRGVMSNCLVLQRSNGAWAGRKSKPLILAAEKGKTFLVVGVVPVTTEVVSIAHEN